jgi:2-methylcitrate dehydratase PrpD
MITSAQCGYGVPGFHPGYETQSPEPGNSTITSAMTVIGQLAEFVAQADAAALPAAEQALQRRHVLDTVVAAAAGASTREARSLAALLGARALPEIVGQRAAIIRLSEVDDIHLPSCTTPSAAAVAVALSLAANAEGFDPARVASAIWAGTEVMTRMGQAVRGPEILYRGVWPSCFAAPLAAAATAARMHGLDARQTADALSLALMLSTRGTGRPHGSPSARWVMFAAAVAAGLTAVEAVRTGYRGDPGLLDGTGFEDTSFEKTWGFALDRDRLAAASPAHSVYPALSIKPFCSAKQSIAAIEAFRTILASGIVPAAIASVRVRVPPAYVAMVSLKAQDQVRTTTLVSAARQLALSALDPTQLYDVDRGQPVTDPAVLGLEAKVEIMADAALTEYYPVNWPAEVEVVSTDGSLRRERVIAAPGDPSRPLDQAAIDDKAHRLLDRLMGRDSASTLIDVAGRGFENEAGCRALADAFVQGFAACTPGKKQR